MRHGGRLESRVSTWPRDHFWRKTIAPIQTHNVKRIFADIDTDHGDFRMDLGRHSVLLVFGAPCQPPLLAGLEHGRTIPLAVIIRIEIPQCSSLQHHGGVCFQLEDSIDAGARYVTRERFIILCSP
jgi:hypothetical protein